MKLTKGKGNTCSSGGTQTGDNVCVNKTSRLPVLDISHDIMCGLPSAGDECILVIKKVNADSIGRL